MLRNLLLRAVVVSLAVGCQPVCVNHQAARRLLPPHCVNQPRKEQVQLLCIIAGNLLRLNSKGPRPVCHASRHSIGGFGRHRVAIVLDDKEDGYFINRCQVEGFIHASLAQCTIPNKHSGNMVGLIQLFCPGHAGGVGDDAALYAIGIKVFIVNMLAAAQSLAHASLFCHNFRHQHPHRPSVGQKMPMTPMVRKNRVALLYVVHQRHSRSLLANIGMGRPRDLALAKQLQNSLLKHSDAEHIVIKPFCFFHRSTSLLCPLPNESPFSPEDSSAAMCLVFLLLSSGKPSRPLDTPRTNNIIRLCPGSAFLPRPALFQTRCFPRQSFSPPGPADAVSPAASSPSHTRPKTQADSPPRV